MIAQMTTTTIQDSDAQDAANLEWRHWRDDADFDAMAHVLNVSKNADGLVEGRTAADLQDMYWRFQNFDLHRDLYLVEHNGELVGYGGWRWRQENSGDLIYDHWRFVLPEWRGRGIEQELLRRAHQHLQEYARAHNQAATKWFEVETGDSQEWVNTLLRENGYQPVRYFYEMVRPNLDNIPDAELPPGIETRPAKPEHMRAIYFGGEEAFAEHWGSPVADEESFQLWLKRPWTLDLWQIAWDGDEFVGMILNRVDVKENEKYGYKRGLTEDIAVRKPWRGRGVAKALLVRSLKMFRDMGYDSTTLGVDSENATGALHLYESVGYQTVRTFTVYRKRI